MILIDILNFLFSGCLSSLIVFILGFYINEHYIKFHKYAKILKNWKFIDYGEYSFSILQFCVIECLKNRPKYLNNIDKFYKKIRINKYSGNNNNDIIKSCMINFIINIFFDRPNEINKELYILYKNRNKD